MQPFPPRPSGPIGSTRSNPTCKVLCIALRLLPAAGLLVWQLGVAGPAQAKAGDLDPSFGRDGKVTTEFFGGSDEAFALAVQDGKLVAAGSADRRSDTDFALARYRSNGRLDRSFGRRGRVTTDFVGGLDQIRALVVQADGKLVAAGFANTRSGTTSDFALARYRPNGALDPSFGGDGKVTTDFAGSDNIATAVAVQADGKLVAAGFVDLRPGDSDFALARYKPDGTLDRSFGTGGKVTTDFAGGLDQAFALVVQANGKLIAAGRAQVTTTGLFDFALARYRPNGSLDASFGTGGKVTTDFADEANALVVQGGKLVAGGSASTTPFNRDFALARYQTR